MADRLRSAWATAESPLDLGALLHNDLQPAAMSLEHRMGDAIDLLRRAGAAVALASGSGPSVFGLFAGPGEARTARDAVAADWDGEAIVVQAAA
jgi:4-diphosphocytidyl-2-C-methyl-D-erythritol kinase